ncbi:MAG: patatin-like phospholipase family protein [Pseudomonadota bacterium]
MHLRTVTFVLLLLFPLAACVPTIARTPLPVELVATTQTIGGQQVRFFGDEAPDNWDAVRRKLRVPADAPKQQYYLAISGGGSDGAFGAGLLKGWGEAGTRPTFTVVTGISAGAITAPFAFLGGKYDEQLSTIFTTISAADLVAIDLRGALGRGSIASSEPFRKLISRYATQEMLDDIAREHRKGRTLLIGTTQLDAQRPIIWDIGALSVSNYPGKLQLFRDVLLASAAIPGAFEPVLIKVDGPSGRFDELHVDGGVTNQVFLYPPQIRPQDFDPRPGVRRTLYVIRNGKVAPDYKVTETLPQIVGRTINTLTKQQGIGDLYRLYVTAQRDKISYNLATIPPSFDKQEEENFDPKYMRALYDVGYRLGRNGYDWQKTPPGFDLATERR